MAHAQTSLTVEMARGNDTYTNNHHKYMAEVGTDRTLNIYRYDTDPPNETLLVKVYAPGQWLTYEVEYSDPHGS